MATSLKRVRARVHGRSLELSEPLSLPENQLVNIIIEWPVTLEPDATARALEASAGAWTDEAHPDLATVDDITRTVGTLRAGFDRFRG